MVRIKNKKKLDNQRGDDLSLLRQVLDTSVSPSARATNKKEAYEFAIATARSLFTAGKFDRLQFDPPEERKEVHVLNFWIQDTGDFDGSDEVKLLSELIGYFDYVTFETQGDLIMVGCMIEDVYV